MQIWELIAQLSSDYTGLEGLEIVEMELRPDAMNPNRVELWIKDDRYKWTIIRDVYNAPWSGAELTGFPLHNKEKKEAS